MTWSLEDLGPSGLQACAVICSVSHGGKQESQGVPLGSCSPDPSHHPSLSSSLRPTNITPGFSLVPLPGPGGSLWSVFLAPVHLQRSKLAFWNLGSDTPHSAPAVALWPQLQTPRQNPSPSPTWPKLSSPVLVPTTLPSLCLRPCGKRFKSKTRFVGFCLPVLYLKEPHGS